MKLNTVLVCLLACTVVTGSAVADRRGDGYGRPGWMLDARHGHNHYYPPPGVAFRALPRGYYTIRYHGAPYYFNQGIWYRRGGAGFIVARPPIGAVIRVLPPFYTTVWFSGIPYYYADDVYYRRDVDENGYVVSDPPPGTDANAEGAQSGSANDDVFAFPKTGQSKQQQATDRYECHRWAADQTGFDPTHSGGGVSAAEADGKRADYRRAQVACLEGRDYSVK